MLFTAKNRCSVKPDGNLMRHSLTLDTSSSASYEQEVTGRSMADSTIHCSPHRGTGLWGKVQNNLAILFSDEIPATTNPKQSRVVVRRGTFSSDHMSASRPTTVDSPAMPDYPAADGLFTWETCSGFDFYNSSKISGFGNQHVEAKNVFL
jgi:hypothetical protein